MCIRFFIIKSVLLTLMLLAWCCVFTKDNFTKFHVLFLFSKLGNARWCHEVNSSSTETFLAVIVRRAPNVLQAAQWRNISYMLETGLLRFDRNFSSAKKWNTNHTIFFSKYYKTYTNKLLLHYSEISGLCLIKCTIYIVHLQHFWISNKNFLFLKNLFLIILSSIKKNLKSKLVFLFFLKAGQKKHFLSDQCVLQERWENFPKWFNKK